MKCSECQKDTKTVVQTVDGLFLCPSCAGAPSGVEEILGGILGGQVSLIPISDLNTLFSGQQSNSHPSVSPEESLQKLFDAAKKAAEKMEPDECACPNCLVLFPSLPTIDPQTVAAEGMEAAIREQRSRHIFIIGRKLHGAFWN